MKREGEEKGGKTTSHKIGEMATALKDNGFATTSMRDERQRQAVLRSPHPVADIIACLVAMRDGGFGDQYDRDHLSPLWATRRTGEFLERRNAPAATNGPVKRGAAAVDQMLARRRQIPPPL